MISKNKNIQIKTWARYVIKYGVLWGILVGLLVFLVRIFLDRKVVVDLYSFVITLGVFMAFGLIVGLISWYLTQETRGNFLLQHSKDKVAVNKNKKISRVMFIFPWLNIGAWLVLFLFWPEPRSVFAFICICYALIFFLVFWLVFVALRDRNVFAVVLYRITIHASLITLFLTVYFNIIYNTPLKELNNIIVVLIGFGFIILSQITAYFICKHMQKAILDSD